MNNDVKTIILDLGVFQNSEITIKNTSWILLFFFFSFLFSGELERSWEEREMNLHSLVQTLYSKLWPGAHFYGQIKNL